MAFDSQSLQSPDRGHRQGTWRVVTRVIAAVLGVGLLVAVILAARQQMTPEKWDAIRSANRGEIATLVGLSTFSVALNGFLWWHAIRPVRTLRMVDTAAVNAIATLLAYVPLKISVVFRATYHRVIDGVPVLQFGGWAFAFMAAVVAGLAPGVIAATFSVRSSLPIWITSTVVGAAVAGLIGASLSRSLSTGKGWHVLRATAWTLGRRRGIRLLHSAPVTNLHTGVVMLASVPQVLVAVGLRLVDAAGIGARFWIAGQVLGQEIDASAAAVGGVCFFVISAAAPTGALGAREVGGAAVFSLFGIDPVAMAPVLVLVSGTQLLGEIIAAGAGVLLLGPRRLFKAKRLAQTSRSETESKTVRGNSASY